MNIIKHKNIFFIISLLVIVPGLISLALWGLDLSIDFTGGSQFSFSYPKSVTAEQQQAITQSFGSNKVKLVSLQTTGQQVTIRAVPVSDQEHTTLLQTIYQKTGTFKEDSFTTIGPTIGGETTKNALLGVGLASLLIVLYIAWSFRAVPYPTSSWRFGVSAIVALLHDALVLLGIFSILGHFFNIEVDSLFITAILTVIGFSVHDTIVVFDRIRENLRRMGGSNFGHVVNESINQTIVRSLNTSLTVILVLLALLLFGGDSTKWFIAALLLGVISGTYSSIFNAAPLLVLWQEIIEKRKKK